MDELYQRPGVPPDKCDETYKIKAQLQSQIANGNQARFSLLRAGSYINAGAIICHSADDPAMTITL